MVLDSGQVSLYLPSLTSGHNSKLLYYHLLKKVSVLSFYGAPIMHSNKLRSWHTSWSYTKWRSNTLVRGVKHWKFKKLIHSWKSLARTLLKNEDGSLFYYGLQHYPYDCFLKVWNYIQLTQSQENWSTRIVIVWWSHIKIIHMYIHTYIHTHTYIITYIHAYSYTLLHVLLYNFVFNRYVLLQVMKLMLKVLKRWTLAQVLE